MRDALGRVESAMVLGGTSDIGLATAERLVEVGCRRVVLAVRDPESPRTAAAIDRLRTRGADAVSTVAFDAAETERHTEAIAEAFEAGDIDVVLLAFGVLGDQADYDDDPLRAVADVQVNYVGAVSAGLVVAERFRRQGHGTLVVLSSVAAERPRVGNYVYGSSKAGLDAFAQGLGDALHGSGGRVIVVRPGFVRSKMTEGMQPQPFSTTPDAVAGVIVEALGREVHTVWAPRVLRWLFVLMRHLPRPLWRLISAR